MHYWDTSTLAKLYVSEPDSSHLSAHLASTGPATSSELARWELFRLVARKESEGLITAGATEVIFNKFLADVAVGLVVLVPMVAAVEERFRDLVSRLHRLHPPVFIRTLDGIHLATGHLHGAAQFVVTDVNLRRCAALLGFQIFP